MSMAVSYQDTWESGDEKAQVLYLYGTGTSSVKDVRYSVLTHQKCPVGQAQKHWFVTMIACIK